MSYYRHAVFGSAADDALAAVRAADLKWRATFALAEAAAKKGDQTSADDLSKQSRDEFDRFVELQKVLADVDARPPLSLGDVTTSKLGAPGVLRTGIATTRPVPAALSPTATPFERWQFAQGSLAQAIFDGDAPDVIKTLETQAAAAKTAYLAASPSFTKQWQDLNDAWTKAIAAKASAAVISDLKTRSEAALAVLARTPKASADAPTKNAVDKGPAAAGTPALDLKSLAIVTSPLWVLALLKRFVL